MERFHLRTLLAIIDKDISASRRGIKHKGHLCFEHRRRNVPVGDIKWAQNTELFYTKSKK